MNAIKHQKGDPQDFLTTPSTLLERRTTMQKVFFLFHGTKFFNHSDFQIHWGIVLCAQETSFTVIISYLTVPIDLKYGSMN
jgi:hypothetical protein